MPHHILRQHTRSEMQRMVGISRCPTLSALRSWWICCALCAISPILWTSDLTQLARIASHQQGQDGWTVAHYLEAPGCMVHHYFPDNNICTNNTDFGEGACSSKDFLKIVSALHGVGNG